MNKTENIQNTDRVGDANDQSREYRLRILRAVLMALSILAGVAFWGFFAYSIVVENVKILMIYGQIIGIMVGVFVPVAILYKLYQRISKL